MRTELSYIGFTSDKQLKLESVMLTSVSNKYNMWQTAYRFQNLDK
jgi:hypothetical protein